MPMRITADENRAMDFAARCAAPRHDCASNSSFADLVEDVFEIKGPAALTQYAGCPDRTARAYSSGDRNPPWTVLRDLLRGDEGYPVLKFVMHDATCTWWLVIQHERAVYARLKDLSPALRGIIDDCR